MMTFGRYTEKNQNTMTPSCTAASCSCATMSASNRMMDNEGTASAVSIFVPIIALLLILLVSLQQIGITILARALYGIILSIFALFSYLYCSKRTVYSLNILH